MVVGYLYHSLGEATSHPDHPTKPNTIFPNHYVIGWLPKLFPCLDPHRPNSDCPGNFSSLVYYAGLPGSRLLLPRLDMFLGMECVSLKLAHIVRTLAMVDM